VGALVTVSRLMHLLRMGGSVGIESRWGGLGGGIGGWSLSRGASLLLVALVLIASTIALVRPPSLPDTSVAAGTASSGGTSQAPAKAAKEP
jgi:hypothetical protein